MDLMKAAACRGEGVRGAECFRERRVLSKTSMLLQWHAYGPAAFSHLHWDQADTRQACMWAPAVRPCTCNKADNLCNRLSSGPAVYRQPSLCPPALTRHHSSFLTHQLSLTCLSLISRWKRDLRFSTGAPRPKQGRPDSAIRATVAMMGSATVRACGVCQQGGQWDIVTRNYCHVCVTCGKMSGNMVHHVLKAQFGCTCATSAFTCRVGVITNFYNRGNNRGRSWCMRVAQHKAASAEQPAHHIVADCMMLPNPTSLPPSLTAR
jgi:hypothetical protein